MIAAFETPQARWPIRAFRRWARIPAHSVLNGGETPRADTVNPAAALRGTLASLVATFSDAKGAVDYAGMARSREYADYLTLAAGLRAFDPRALNDEDAQKAFWLNLYNALIVHAVIALRLTGGPVRGWYERSAYVVAGFRFSANDIEHGVLRTNRWHLLGAGPQFGRSDPRLAFSLSALDPRVHFALNCAARSCPPIRAYLPDRLEAQLDLATASFLSGGQFMLDRATMRVWLSRLFQYYGPDFGGGPLGLWNHTALIRFAARYIPDAETRTFLETNAPRLKLSFLPYDWSLNAYDPE